jgi:TM2 domain-containing membrane protein YozV
MDCVNHSGTPAVYFCQNCGRPLCADCIVSGALGHVQAGQILCKDCITSWQQRYQPFAQPVYVPPPPSGPNPAAAAVLGLVPGVGAMYNGQFFKGFLHVIVFAVLIGLTDNYPIFGLFIAAWVLYQSFEAYHTARALRDGLPLPDPFGLNEVGNWLNLGGRPRNPVQPGAGLPPADGQAQPPYQAPYTSPFCCGRREPVGAIVLIALGILFLLAQLDIFHGRLLEFAWPLLLIALGVWLIVRRIDDTQGGSK